MTNGSELSGTWIPSYPPRSSRLISVLLVLCSCITSTTFGYDGSMINGLNILPSYTNYFVLDPATTGLNTASVWIGGCLAPAVFPIITDRYGRRPALFWAAIITIIGVILQTAAQNVGMFVVARIFIGFGTTASGLAGPVFLAETFPYNWRAWGVGIFNDCYYVGGLIAAGVTLGTSKYTSTWAWRAPSLVQGIFSILCIVILPFVPESPRWMAYQGHFERAHLIVAKTHANGDVNDQMVLAQFKEIVDTLEYERNVGETLSPMQIVKTHNARKRVLLACSAAVFSTIAGNVIASYYLGSMLDNAGITDYLTQLRINVILNAWCLVCSLGGTHLVNSWGRKPTAVLCASLLTIFLFMVGALTKVYGNSTNNSGIYGTVACIFLFQGAYSIGWTPLLYLYPPEVMNYPIRANGMGVFQFALNGTALLFVFTMPIALANIGWKLYMINGSWDILIVLVIAYYWIETRGKSLEEIDAAIDGNKHSDVPDLEAIKLGKEEVGEGVAGEMADVEGRGEKGTPGTIGEVGEKTG